MRQVIFFVVLVTVATFGTFADTLFIEYTEGSVEFEENGRWYEAYIGDTVPEGSRLRVSENGYVEVETAGRLLHIGADGTYLVNDLIAVAQQDSGGSVRSALRTMAEGFGRDQEGGRGTVAGVRASEAVAGGTEWVGGDIEELVSTGIDLLNEQEYETAYEVFSEAWDYASFEEEPEVLFYLGYTANSRGDLRGARDYLTMEGPDPSSEFFEEHLLTLAGIYSQMFAYQETVDLLGLHLDDLQDGANVQLANYLMGVSHVSLGEPGNALPYLRQAAEMSADPEVAENAAGILADL